MTRNDPGKINMGNITGSNINIGGDNVQQAITQHVQNDQIKIAFEPIYKIVSNMAKGSNKEDALDTIQKIEKEAREGNNVDETRLQRLMNFLAETAPDAWDVAVKAFLNPIDGVSEIFRKIAQRSKKKGKSA